MVLRLTRDRTDERRLRRTILSFVASLFLHALAALFLFSLATSSSQQAAPEAFTSGAVVTVTREAPQRPAPVRIARAQIPQPHAPIVHRPRAAVRPQTAPQHPRVLHELSKFAPTAPPNPTPAPVSSAAPLPVPTQAPQIAVTQAPIVAAVPTSVPVAVTAVSMKIPPTAAPTPRPSAPPTVAPAPRAPQPTAAPTQRPATPAPEPSALEATAAPIAALASPQPLVTPGSQTQVRIVASQQKGNAPTPGPTAIGSPGPKAVAAVRGPSVARPIQAPPSTPRPGPAAVGKHGTSLNRRLQNLIPTANPSFTPAPMQHYSAIDLRITPPPEPTPPPEVLAATKFLYVENVGSQRWKQSYLGTAPEEQYVKMYVTGVKRIGFINWCTGWVLRSPIGGDAKWIIEPNSSFICAGHLEPFTPPSPEPPKGS